MITRHTIISFNTIKTLTLTITLLALIERRMGINLDYEFPTYVAVEESTGKVIGGACCVPKDVKPGILGLLRAGLLVWPFYWGLHSAMRGVSVDEELDTIEKRVCPDSEAQLQTVAVSSAWQGKGVGKGLVRTVLADARISGLSVSLSTQKEQNLPFYASLGFMDATEHEVCGFKSWTMTKPK